MMQHDAYIIGRIGFLAFKWVILRLDQGWDIMDITIPIPSELQ